MEIALHDIFLVIPFPTAWAIRDLHQTAAVEEEPCPSVLGIMSPGAVELVEDGAFGRLRCPFSVPTAIGRVLD